MIFSYKAKDGSGNTRSGTLDASSVAELATKLGARGLQVLEVAPLGGTPDRPASLPGLPNLADVHWPKLAAGIAGLVVLLLALSWVPRLLRPTRTYHISITGRVQGTGKGTFSRSDTRVYVYLPQLNRTIRGDGQQFELTGGRMIPGQIATWRPYTDPSSSYDVTWKENEYTVKVSVSSSETPKTCRVTVFKTGFTRARTPEFGLLEGSQLQFTGTAPDVMLSPRAGAPLAPGRSPDSWGGSERRGREEGPGADSSGAMDEGS